MKCPYLCTEITTTENFALGKRETRRCYFEECAKEDCACFEDGKCKRR